MDFNAYDTILSQWIDLIRQAEQQSRVFLPEEVESYLVFLLMRFTQRPNMVTVILAEEFLQATQVQGYQQHEKMRDVADSCLLHAGFYPARAMQKNVDCGYFIELGRMAYGSLTLLPRKIWTGPYADLENSIDDAAKILSRLQDHPPEKNSEQKNEK